MSYEDALAALADSTRRAVFDRLRRRPHTVGELARLVHVSQPAISQHCCGLRSRRGWAVSEVVIGVTVRLLVMKGC